MYRIETFTDQTPIKNFYPIPKELLECNISMTSMLVYGALLSRAGHKRSKGCTRRNTPITIKYPESELADDLYKSLSTIKRCMRELTLAGLISRKKGSIGLTQEIYIKVPVTTFRPGQ